MARYVMGQKVLFLTEHFGRKYLWLEDIDGAVYMIKAKPVYQGSVSGITGEQEIFISGYLPDFS